ncbi:GNAT family N-acetyltransferase [Deinococcus sp. NW-56]|uniref:GNAT family N-acetyltransferase n=1 Tax=Deinococcus sp. NW-56 TaxID=2080419 RepID=UPI000CF45CA5|nr:GNAT family N-acetyltransferase [Deinococcus sp. NW-56]
MTPRIRPAQTFDAAFAAPLIQEATRRVGQHLTGTTSDEDAAHVIAEFFVARGNRLSFTHTLIAEGEDGRPVGLAVLYPGEFAQALDAPFREHRRSLGLDPAIPSEAEAGELYLDTLATVAEARGRGVGRALIEACAERARALGLPLTLLVEDGNPAARLYARSGFVAVGRQDLAGHAYTRLARQPDV